MKLPHDGPVRLTPDEVVEFAKLPTLDEWLDQRVEVIRPLLVGVVPSLPLDGRLLPNLSLDELITVFGCFVRHTLAPNNLDTTDSLNFGRMECLRYFMVHRNGSEWLDDLAKRLTDIPEGFKPDWWSQPVCKDGFHEITAILRKSTLGNWPPEKAVLERLEKLRKTVQETVPGPGRVGAPGATIVLSSPPWRKKIAPSVKRCLLAYLAGDKEFELKKGDAYFHDPGRLALLVRNQIAYAVKSKKSPFIPLKGRVPVGRSAGGLMLISFDGDEKPTKNARKPRES